MNRRVEIVVQPDEGLKAENREPAVPSSAPTEEPR